MTGPRRDPRDFTGRRDPRYYPPRPPAEKPEARLSPAEVRELLPAGGRVLAVFADRPLHRPQLAQIAYAARTIAGHVLLLVPVGPLGPERLAPEALIRTVLAARDRLPSATVVAVPLHRRDDDIADALVRSRVAENYGATHVLTSGGQLTGGGPRALLPRELAREALLAGLRAAPGAAAFG